MDSLPLISIIIPVYNVELYLRECLDSLFTQDLAGCEVIAVNDGSTDGSRAILEEYRTGHPEVLTIVDKTNGGLSSARNAGVEKAQGDYFYFMDSDDYLKPHALSSIRHAVDVSEHADVIYLDCIVTDHGERRGEHMEKDIPLMDFRSFFSYVSERGMEITPNAFSYVYSSAYWRRAGLRYEEGIKYEDTLFESMLFVREDGTIKVIHVEEPFYVYRIGRDGSISTKLTLQNFTDKQFIRKSADKLWSGLGINDIAYYHKLFDASIFMLYEAYETGLIKEYRRFWDKDDVRILRKGVSNEREYGLWLLAKINPKWMACYYANELPRLCRRMTNRMLTVCIKMFYKNAEKG